MVFQAQVGITEQQEGPRHWKQGQRKGHGEHEFPQYRLPFLQLTPNRNQTLAQPVSLIPCLATAIMPAQHSHRWISFSRIECGKRYFSTAMITSHNQRGKKARNWYFTRSCFILPGSPGRRALFLRSQWELWGLCIWWGLYSESGEAFAASP